MELKFISNSREETIQLGELISRFVFPGSVITLTGDLGAGKTTLTSGVALGLGITEKVSSPTFNIMKCYFNAKHPLYHIDAYRLEDGTNKILGLEEYIEGDGVCLIEWPNFIQELIDDSLSLNIEIHHLDLNRRSFIFTTKNNRYSLLFQTLKERYHD